MDLSTLGQFGMPFNGASQAQMGLGLLGTPMANPQGVQLPLSQSANPIYTASAPTPTQASMPVSSNPIYTAPAQTQASTSFPMSDAPIFTTSAPSGPTSMTPSASSSPIFTTQAPQTNAPSSIQTPQQNLYNPIATAANPVLGGGLKSGMGNSFGGFQNLGSILKGSQ